MSEKELNLVYKYSDQQLIKDNVYIAPNDGVEKVRTFRVLNNGNSKAQILGTVSRKNNFKILDNYKSIELQTCNLPNLPSIRKTHLAMQLIKKGEQGIESQMSNFSSLMDQEKLD